MWTYSEILNIRMLFKLFSTFKLGKTIKIAIFMVETRDETGWLRLIFRDENVILFCQTLVSSPSSFPCCVYYMTWPSWFLNSSKNNSNRSLTPPAGEDERQEQTGASSAGYHQGERDEGGWEDEGGDPGVEPDKHQTLGCLTKELHPGELFIMGRQNMSLTLSCCPKGSLAVDLLLRLLSNPHTI